MLFGAERRAVPASGKTALRRSEPAVVAFLVMFGASGYLLTRHGALTSRAGAAVAVLLSLAWAAIVTRLAIATARIQPEHDHDDLRYLLQGRVAVVTTAIPANGEGLIRYEDAGEIHVSRACNIAEGAIAVDEEVCIECVENGVAQVELWRLVEQRL